MRSPTERFGKPQEFFRLCRRLSAVSLAQGFGGNISAKVGPKEMLVKASGARLSEVGQKKGYVAVSYPRAAIPYTGKGKLSESGAERHIASCVLGGPGKKPSMEAGFHSFLGTYVAHLHPVHLNIILCQQGGQALLSSAMGGGEFTWCPYRRPGHELALEISRLGRHGTFMLQNHGIISSSESSRACASGVLSAEAKAKEFLRDSIHGFAAFSYRPPERLGPCLFANRTRIARQFSSDKWAQDRFLFPDAVVFSQEASAGKIRIQKGQGIFYLLPLQQARAVDETLAAHMYVLEMSERLGNPRYLSKRECAALLGMHAEKGRQKEAGI